MSTDNPNENNNLMQLDGTDLVKQPNTSMKAASPDESFSSKDENMGEFEDDSAKDYIDVYLKKISRTRFEIMQILCG